MKTREGLFSACAEVGAKYSGRQLILFFALGVVSLISEEYLLDLPRSQQELCELSFDHQECPWLKTSL